MDYSPEKREFFLMSQTYATLVSLAGKIENHANKYFKGMTSRQYMAVLAAFHLPPEETTLKNIAHKLGTTKQNANQLIFAVKKKGYITVSNCESDKRAINFQMTDSGLASMAKNSDSGFYFMADIFMEFTEKELKTLWDLLKKLHAFDGEAYSGFEADASGHFKGAYSDQQAAKVYEEFRKKRRKNLLLL